MVRMFHEGIFADEHTGYAMYRLDDEWHLARSGVTGRGEEDVRREVCETLAHILAGGVP